MRDTEAILKEAPDVGFQNCHRCAQWSGMGQGWLQVSRAKFRDMKVRGQMGHGLQQYRGARASQTAHSPPTVTPSDDTDSGQSSGKGSRRVADLGSHAELPP